MEQRQKGEGRVTTEAEKEDDAATSQGTSRIAAIMRR